MSSLVVLPYPPVFVLTARTLPLPSALHCRPSRTFALSPSSESKKSFLPLLPRFCQSRVKVSRSVDSERVRFRSSSPRAFTGRKRSCRLRSLRPSFGRRPKVRLVSQILFRYHHVDSSLIHSTGSPFYLKSLVTSMVRQREERVRRVLISDLSSFTLPSPPRRSGTVQFLSLSTLFAGKSIFLRSNDTLPRESTAISIESSCLFLRTSKSFYE